MKTNKLFVLLSLFIFNAVFFKVGYAAFDEFTANDIDIQAILQGDAADLGVNLLDNETNETVGLEFGVGFDADNGQFRINIALEGDRTVGDVHSAEAIEEISEAKSRVHLPYHNTYMALANWLRENNQLRRQSAVIMVGPDGQTFETMNIHDLLDFLNDHAFESQMREDLQLGGNTIGGMILNPLDE